MPVFIVVFGMAYSFFMFMIPKQAGLFNKIVFSTGLAAAAVVIFVLVAPDLAMTKLG